MATPKLRARPGRGSAALPWQGAAHRAWYRVLRACLALYLTYAMYTGRSGLFGSAAETLAALAVSAAVFAGLWWGLGRLADVRFGFALRAERARLSVRMLLLGAGVALLVLVSLLLANDPGGMTVDSAVQWTQALTGRYVNWHPVFHTLLLRLCALVKPDYTFAVAAQCLLYSLALGYLLATLHAWGVKALPLLAAGALLTAAPIVGNTLMYLWKDNAMTVGALLLTAQGVNLYVSRGRWLQKGRNAVAFGLALAFVTLVRHNGLLFSLPMLLAAALTCRAQLRGALTAAAALVAALALVLGPLYGALGVRYPSNGLEESIGVPMTVVCDVRKTDPDALDARTRAFTDRMAGETGWQAYQLGVYNSIKFGATRGLIAHSSLGEVLRMAASAAAARPQTAFAAVNRVTDLVWGLADAGEANVKVRNSGDLPSVPRGAAARLPGLGAALQALVTAPLRLWPLSWYTGNLGVSFALMLVCALIAVRRFSPRALPLCLPTLLYNLGTMCVLCGGDARFFSYSPLVCTLLLPVLLARAPAPQPPTLQNGMGAAQ